MAAKKKKPAKKAKKAPVRKAAAVKKKSTAKKKPAARSASLKPAAASHAMHSHGHAAHHDHSLPAQLWRRSHYKTLKEFWPFYLHEHSVGLNRTLHFIGSTLAVVILAIAIGTQKYWLIAPAVVSGYAFAWVGHFFLEKNRPATFKYPLKSLISDWRMWYCTLTGQIAKEMEHYGISSR